MKSHTTFHRDGTITTWNIYRQAWIKRAYPSDIFDLIWASETKENREKWTAHEKKQRRKQFRPLEVGSMKPDTLQNRIYSGNRLSEREIAQLVMLLGRRCRETTKRRLLNRLSQCPLLTNHGIYDRVILSPNMHVAGQDYPSEIRTVRQCLIGR